MPNKVTVVRGDVASQISTLLGIVESLEVGWIGIANANTADVETLASWVKTMRQKSRNYKAVIYSNAVPSNNEGVVDYSSKMLKATFADGNERTFDKVIPTLLGIYAGANVEHGTTYLKIPNLLRVTH